MRVKDRVLVNGCENPRFNGCVGVIVEVYGRGNHKAIVDVTLSDGTIGKLLFDAEYPFGCALDNLITMTCYHGISGGCIRCNQDGSFPPK